MFSSNDTAIQYWNQLSSIYYTQHWIHKDTSHRILTLKEFMVFSERWKHHQLEKIVYTRIPSMRRRAGQTVMATSFQRGQSGRINCPFPLVSVCPQLGKACNRKVSCGRIWGWVPQYDVEKLFFFGASYISETSLNLWRAKYTWISTESHGFVGLNFEPSHDWG